MNTIASGLFGFGPVGGYFLIILIIAFMFGILFLIAAPIYYIYLLILSFFSKELEIKQKARRYALWDTVCLVSLILLVCLLFLTKIYITNVWIIIGVSIASLLLGTVPFTAFGFGIPMLASEELGKLKRKMKHSHT